MKTQILKIDHLIKVAFEKCADCDYINVVIGKYKEDADENNTINILPVIGGYSDNENSTLIETEMPCIGEIAVLITQCLMLSKLDFDSIQGLNMDGSNIDPDNMKTDMVLKIYF